MNIELIKKSKFKNFSQVTTKVTMKNGKKITLNKTKQLYKDLKKQFGEKIVIRGLTPIRWSTIVSFQTDINDYGFEYVDEVAKKNKFKSFFELEINILKYN